MTCAGCEAAVRMAARSVEGVTEAKASYAKANAEVTYDPSKTTPAAIAKVITDKSGFKADPIPPHHGSRVAVAFVPAAQTSPPAFQYIARSTAIGCVRRDQRAERRRPRRGTPVPGADRHVERGSGGHDDERLRRSARRVPSCAGTCSVTVAGRRARIREQDVGLIARGAADAAFGESPLHGRRVHAEAVVRFVPLRRPDGQYCARSATTGCVARHLRRDRPRSRSDGSSASMLIVRRATRRDRRASSSTGAPLSGRNVNVTSAGSVDSDSPRRMNVSKNAPVAPSARNHVGRRRGDARGLVAAAPERIRRRNTSRARPRPAA